ncbi:MAG: Gx transporter family protein [Treponema sp.]|nr:Gx transporter family protein [Treponema sp.]
MNIKNQNDAFSPRMHLISFFAALCMFLSAIEYIIPKPLPFMRLGLANLPILLSLTKMKRKDTFILIALKVLLQGFISGTLFSYIFLFSAGGTLASGIAMMGIHSLFHKKQVTSFIGISLAGALANNIVQLLLARWILFGKAALYITPLLFTVGLITGVALGIFANLFAAQSVWYKQLPSYRTI